MVRNVKSAWSHIFPSKNRLLQTPIEKMPIEVQTTLHRVVDKEGTGKKKVLIAIPSFGDPPVETWESYLAFAYHLGRRNQDYDFFMRVIPRKEQFRARNNLAITALIHDMDYILYLDSDMILRPDIFERLVAHGKDVTGCLYYQRGGSYEPVLMKEIKKPDGTFSYAYIHNFPRGLVEVDVIGGACMLIKTEVLGRMEQPWFWIDGIVGTDIQLCHKARMLGYRVYCDTSVEIGHVGDRTIVTERTIPMGLLGISREQARLREDLQQVYAVTQEQMEHSIEAAMATRGGVGEVKEGESFEEYVSAYNKGDDMMAFNLAGWNLQYDSTIDYALSLFRYKPKDKILDYGAGVGFVSLPLAERGYDVTTLDIPTQAQKFLKRRADLRSIYMRHITLNDWLWNTDEKFNVILMISVINHLPNAMDALKWCVDHLEDGGYMIMDSYQDQKQKKEPQHLCSFNPYTIGRDMRNMGLVQSEESPYLFRKETIKERKEHLDELGTSRQKSGLSLEENERRENVQAVCAV